MSAPQLNNFSQRRFAWLLGLVLLLPLAQSAATWHLLSHVQPVQYEQPGDDQAIHLGHCDLCLTAAAIAGGALPVQSTLSAPILAPSVAPASRSSTIWIGWLLRPYESRAPPSSPY